MCHLQEDLVPLYVICPLYLGPGPQFEQIEPYFPILSNKMPLFLILSKNGSTSQDTCFYLSQDHWSSEEMLWCLFLGDILINCSLLYMIFIKESF